MSAELPVGWRIEESIEFEFMEVEHIYTAYKWKTWTEKKWFREPVTKGQWIPAGYHSRSREQTAEWILDTVAAIEAGI